ncbi:PREDICTED: tetratricopeptide repeat protein 37 [Dinoponera quadriceps]|uniref:Tetratricopeptide repeat protein 37 n=1 Tax=Dinoponera quadriceps TaxID=609295 RepID=A0A6P3Y480_DINQU|nr:PREDICTED: tetratricopeptide repeat protein 37 [Dinoponera quadriceps]XP_014485630.1 PREDICTED: tetratricopeptide repeat protein 37 [Dinoponera quadriceps]XP_014485631.1 PREDICTED: tetratricopeptide repeat protein 37 [Dinoponera quadriceps]XP_014485632.1 PREDICTED: tetratricopeptide repeat protein 37 [Dinoponera quadriceps]
MSTEVKALLKEARESFKQHEYMETIKKCRKIVKSAKTNYPALVLLAAAMQEMEEFKPQVMMVLQKAVKLQPTNPVAWQGLVAHYEKAPVDDDNWKMLAQAYCKLVQLDSDSPKFMHFLNKVTEMVLKYKDDEVLSEVLDTLSRIRQVPIDDKTSLVNKTLAHILTEYPNTLCKYQGLYESVLSSVIRDTDLVNRYDYYKKYLKMLYDGYKFTVLLAEAKDMHTQFPQDSLPLEWICRVYYEETVLNERELEIDITYFCESLLKLNMSSTIALIAKATYLMRTDSLINCRECLNQAILLNAQSFDAWFLLNKVYRKLYCWQEVEEASRQTLRLLRPPLKDKLRHKIKLTLLEAMSRSCDRRKLLETRQMCNELLKNNFSAQLRLINARIDVTLDEPSVMDALNDLESQDEIKLQVLIVKATLLKKLGHLEEATNVLEQALESSDAWLLFGQIYWDMGDYNHSLVAFLNGVKADRHNWRCMIHLGRYYRECANDVERSRRCYQTALQINPSSEEAGIGLSTAYRLLKNTDANIQLLQRVTMQGNGPKWAWLQLGLQHLDDGDAGEAIKALQHVIRADPNDNHSWESLADAYLVRGAHMSALKSYQRALQLSPGSLYPMIQLANIKLLIGQHEEAKADFENILQNDEQYVLALKGLGQACLGLARENTAKQFLSRARENLQQAVDSLTSAVMIRSDLSCNWKLLGDVCYRIAAMPGKHCYLRVKPILIRSDSAEKHIKIKGEETLKLSIRCFCRALSLAQNSALLWHDLACCYSMQLRRNSTINKSDVAARCFAAAKQAVKLCPQSWLHWNILGVICMSLNVRNYALAQHCFVMATDREPNNAIAWSNLGTLYLHLGDMYRANEAYSRAQRADPCYMNSWIGQGLIAQRFAKKEAMELFQHSTKLGYHDEAVLGYVHWVLHVLLDPTLNKEPSSVYFIENMHAISAATDVLTWYLEREPDDVYALNTHGLLLERQKLHKSAADRFAAALKLVEALDEKLDMINVNLARVLIQLGQHDEAVRLCGQVKRDSFNSQCQLALSLFKAEQYEKSYESYETALHWLADTDMDTAYVLCAMGAIAYICNKPDAVKTLLFQCLQTSQPVMTAYLALAALGILHDDFDLTSLVLKELKLYEDHSEYGHHAVTLAAYYHVSQRNITEAIRVLAKGIHKYPNDVRYWVRLVRILLLDTNLSKFRKCAGKALSLSRNTSTTDIVYVACASAYSHLGTKEALRQAQKNVFTYPANVESWASLIAVLLHRRVDEDCEIDNRWLSSLISITEAQFQTSEHMSRWLAKAKEMSSDS